jgi:putative membrane protein
MMGFGFGGFGLIFMLLFWVAIIVLAVWLLSSLFPRVTNTSPTQPALPRHVPSESALEILKQRYARGEISKTEYEDMRRDLDV